MITAQEERREKKTIKKKQKQTRDPSHSEKKSLNPTERRMKKEVQVHHDSVVREHHSEPSHSVKIGEVGDIAAESRWDVPLLGESRSWDCVVDHCNGGRLAVLHVREDRGGDVEEGGNVDRC